MEQKLFLKKFDSRPVAHIFEHILTFQFEEYVYKKYNYFEFLNYEIYAKTHDNYAFFKIKAEPKIIKEFEKFQDKLTFSDELVKRAIKEVSIEWEYPYWANFEQLIIELKQNSITNWLDLSQIKITAPPTQKDWQLRSKNIWYFKSKQEKIDLFDIEYSYKALKNNSINKIIATYLIRLEKILQINLCYANFYKIEKNFEACYSFYDEWHEYPYEESPKIVEFYHQLGFLLKDKVKIKDFKEFYLKNHQKLIEDDFIKRAIKFIKQDLEQDFWMEEEIFIRTGLYFDKQELLKNLTEENVKKVFDDIKISFSKK